MKVKAIIDFQKHVGTLFLTVLLLLPIGAYAQNISTIKRLQQVHSYWSYFGTGPDGYGADTYRFLYDSNNRFQINSYRSYGYIYQYDSLLYSWDQTFDFAGYTQFNADHFIYTTPTMSGQSVRTCVVSNDGYILEDNYSYSPALPAYIVTNKYEYNANMRLVQKLRTYLPQNIQWKTICILDSLDRRIEEISYKSVDSINWVPSQKIQYSYTGEQSPTPCEFEKCNLYLPDCSFYYNSGNWGQDIYFLNYAQSLYICDNWSMGDITLYDYYNQEWAQYWEGTTGFYHGANGYYASFPYGAYVWDHSGMPISISGAEEGTNTYEYIFTAPSGLEDNHESVPSAFSIAAYPNPNRGETQLVINSDKHEQLRICTYNIRGQKVKEETLSTTPSASTTVQWQATDMQNKPLPNGVYLLSIISGSHREVKRITVAK